MKNIITQTGILFCFLIFFGNQILANWEELPNIPFTTVPGTDGAVSFTIDGKGYVGGGPGVAEFFRYDPQTNQWEKLADIGGGERGWAFHFVIDGIAYVGGGDPEGNLQNLKQDFWKYDPNTNEWTQLGDFPGGPRDACFNFSINGKGYIGGGFSGENVFNEVWEYDPQNDNWTIVSTYPEQAILFGTSFIIDERVFVGLGNLSFGVEEYTSFFEFNLTNYSWIPKANFPGKPRQTSVGFAMNGKGYVGGGQYQYTETFRDFYEYEPIEDTWTLIPEMELPYRNTAWSCGFTIGEVIYFGTGVNLPEFEYSGRFFKYSFAEKEPAPIISVSTFFIDFDKVDIGESSSSQITINNSGDADLHINNIWLDDDYDGVLSIDALDFPIIIQPDNEFAINIHFKPSSEEFYIALLTIESNDPKNDEIQISVGGEGVASNEPFITVSDIVLNYNSVEIGNTEIKSLTIGNEGQSVLIIESIEIQGLNADVFEIVSELDFPFYLGPSGNLIVEIRFTPQMDIEYEAKLIINSNAENGEVSTMLIGKGESNVGVNETISHINGLKSYINYEDNSLVILFNSEIQTKFEIDISDINGHKISSVISYNSEFGENLVRIPMQSSYLQNIANGIYFITLKTNDTFESLKVLYMK